MLFNSLSFLIFLPVVFLGYWLLPKRFRKFFLLMASCYFYMAFVPKYILILFFLITLDYFLAFLIHNAPDKKRKLYLILSILANIGTLVFFKYFNFINENIVAVSHALNFNYQPYILNIALPLGLSFHVFQSLSYVIEVYRKKYVPEKNYLHYALYVLLFSQLVAGPIERPQHLLPQLNADQKFDYVKARRGLERIMWGFFKKLVIADHFSRIISSLYVNLPPESLTIFIVMVMFTYQLYCDFSGYSDIAVGSAMLFGLELTENFNRPFSAKSIGEFWRKWHISLSSWLRDYLYYPLIFSWGKVSKYKLYISSFLTFAIIGLWHGANWTYVIFGAVHGIYLVVETASEKIRIRISKSVGLTKKPSIHSFLQRITVFFLVLVSLIFFRAESVTRAFWMFRNLFTLPKISFFINQVLYNPVYVGVRWIFVQTVIATILMEIIQYYQSRNKTIYIFENKSKIIKYGFYYATTIAIIMLGYFGGQSFIYFKF